MVRPDRGGIRPDFKIPDTTNEIYGIGVIVWGNECTEQLWGGTGQYL